MANQAEHTDLKLNSAGMNCPICLEVYTDPRALSCLHTFCYDCIHAHVMNSNVQDQTKEGIECPICEDVTVMTAKRIASEQWASTLPANYALVPVLQEIYEDTSSYAAPRMSCKPCEKKGEKREAVVLCPTCNEYQCEICAEVHRQFGFMANHTLIGLKNRLTSTEPVDYSHLLSCSEHGKPIEFYCRTDNRLCCSTCVIIPHKQCVTVEIQTISSEKAGVDIGQILTSIDKTADVLFDKMAEIETTIDGDISTIKKELAFTRESLLRKLAEFENDVSDKTLSTKQSILDQHKVLRRQISGLKAAVKASLAMVNSVTEKTPTDVRFAVTEKMKHQCYMYQKTNETATSSIKGVKMCLEVSDAVKSICEPDREIGFVDITSRTKLGGYSITEQYNLISSVELKQTDGHSEPLITGLEFASNGRIVAVDNKNKELWVMNGDLKRLNTIQLSYRPYSITVSSSNEIILTSENKRISIFFLDGTHNLNLYQNIESPILVNSISEKDLEHFVVGTYDQHVPVSIVSRQGKVALFATEFPARIYNIDDKQCTYSRLQDVLVTTFRFQDEICIHNVQTKTTFTVKEPKLIKEPRGVTVSNVPRGNFYVCSSETNAVVEISADGNVLSCHHLENMKFPYNIAVSQDNNNLLVSNCHKGEKKILLFKLVHKNGMI